MEQFYVNGAGEDEAQAKESAVILKRRMRYATILIARLPAEPAVIFCPGLKETGTLTDAELVHVLGRDLQSGFPAPFHLPFPQVGSAAHPQSGRVLEAIRTTLAKAPKGQIFLHCHGAGAAVVAGALSHLTPAQLQQINVRTYGGTQLMGRPTHLKSCMQFFHAQDFAKAANLQELVAAPDLKAFFDAVKPLGLPPPVLTNYGLLYLSQKDAALGKLFGSIQLKPGGDHAMHAYIDTCYPK